MSESRRSDAGATSGHLGGSDIQEHRLRNGLRILVASRHLDPVVAVMVFYSVGSVNERVEEAGLSHFLEHMMFKGTPNLGKGMVDHLTTELGGSNNAFTTYDHTAYWFELASDRWETAMQIEADRMQNLLLDPSEFAAEKAVVLEELSMGLDDPWRRLSRSVSEVLFGRHPYGRPIIGYADVLERATPEDMRAYYERFYHPGNATLVVAGDVTASAALKAARKYFGKIAAGPDRESIDPWRPGCTAPSGERRLTLTWDDASSRLMMAWPGAPVGTDDDFALDLVSTILTGGRLSRLYRRLVIEEGLATTVSTSNDARVEGGAFWLSAEAVAGVSREALEGAIDEEIERLASESVPAADLKRAKSILGASEAFEAETISDLAEHLGGYAVDADWPMATQLSERRKQVRAADIKRVATELLAARHRVVGWSVPEAGR